MKGVIQVIMLLGFLMFSGALVLNSENLFASENIFQSGDLVKITGSISVKGSEPNTYVSLRTAKNKIYRLTGPLETLIREKYQYMTLRVSGTIESEAIGPGFPAVFTVLEILEVIEK